MNDLNNKLRDILNEVAETQTWVVDDDDNYKEIERNYLPAIQALITEQVRLGRIDELLSSDDVIRLHGLEDYQAYLTKRVAQLKDTTLLEGEK